MTQAFNLSQLANNVNSTGLLNAAAGLYNQLPVANGGTGSSTLTLNAVLLGNATSALQTIAAGTSGNVLTSTGTTWVSQTASGGTPIVRIYTSPSPWTKPATLKAVKVQMVAAGGSGGSGCTSPALNAISGGPGGNGGILQGYAQASAIPGPVTISVGSGNVGGLSNAGGGNAGGPGVTGGTSSFGTIFSTTGGAAGGGQSGPVAGSAGAPGGSYAITTTPTTSSLELTSPTAIPVMAYGVRGLTGPTTKNASGYGMGGLGTAGPNPGGSSSGGFMIVEEFY